MLTPMARVDAPSEHHIYLVGRIAAGNRQTAHRMRHGA